MSDSPNYAEIISDLRRRSKWTQADLANQLGVSLPSVNRWEKGKAVPEKLARQALTDIIRRQGDKYADLLDALEGEGGDFLSAGENPKVRGRGRPRKVEEPAAPAYGETGKVMETRAMEQMLWQAACSIRGEKDAPKFKDYILPLVFLKRISDVFDDEFQRLVKKFGDEETAAELLKDDPSLVRFFVPEEARWNVVNGRQSFKWKPGKEPKTVGERVTQALRAVARVNDTLQGVVDTVDFNETRNGEREISDEALKRVIELLSDPRYRLGMKEVEPDFLGRCYEYLLRKFAEGQGTSAGEFYTPKEVGWLMALILKAEEGQRVYDPCCGSAGLLIKCELALKERLGGKVNEPLTLYGQEFTGSSFAIARMNMVLHDMQGEIVRGDSMRNPKFLENGKLDRFDLVISNPMWNQKAFDPEADYENDRFGRFEPTGGYAPTSSADWAWLQHITMSLKDDGRAAVVLDTGAVSRGSGNEGDNKEKLIRQWFVDHDLIEAVVLLPDNLFYNTTAAGIVIVLNKAKPKARRNKIILVNASEQFEKGRPKNFLPDAAIRKIADAFHAGKDAERFVKVVGTEEIAKKDYNLSPSAYVTTAAPTEHREIQPILDELNEIIQKAQNVDRELGEVFSSLGYKWSHVS